MKACALFNLPRYSQFLDVRSARWKPRACGIVALKTVLDYWRGGDLKTKPTISNLINSGLSSNSYVQGIGWKHKGIVSIASQYGMKGKNYDWFKRTPEKAFEMLSHFLQKGPVLASIHKDFRSTNGGHLIVLLGINGSRIFYNEPAAKTRGEIAGAVGKKTFLRGWKRRIIVIKPKTLPKRKKLVQ